MNDILMDTLTMPETEIQKFFREYLSYLEIEKGRSPKTSINYRHYLEKFFAFTKARTVADIDERAVVEFRQALARQKTGDGAELKKITQSYYVIAIRNFLKYLAKRDVPALAAEKIELPKTPSRQIETLREGDLERLIAAPTKSLTEGDGKDAARFKKFHELRALRDRAIIETFFSTGLRLAELCSLSRYGDWKHGEVSVRGKGDKIRVVFFSDSAREAIQKYLDRRAAIASATEEKLFVSIDKSGRVVGPITPRAVQRLISQRAREAGIAGKIHPHQLRHSFATDLLLNGADIRSVQALLGHSNIATTQVYTHLTDKQLKEVHEKFHARGK